MSSPAISERARQQAAMWLRLAEQCRRCGDHDLEQEAAKLALRYQLLVEHRDSRVGLPSVSGLVSQQTPAGGIDRELAFTE
ncbi:hypothetical protein [Oleiagrimonas soli]|uniref:Uncharacterized protein n=1 Tax=Oleiagrimonas soli TaxID=1543381 RepID=A0A099CTF0_9GAMM|nr:hypothetical protein [Oleiagrimonas soli]KGI77009.1 hypothetical protein LF63_0112105 [Oleiagrimonas soli]MBB6185481.1 hypothetical protein [Oleiagrimonas soli]